MLIVILPRWIEFELFALITTVRARHNIIRDHRARLVSSNRECFAHYRHISYFFNKSSLSLQAGTPYVLPAGARSDHNKSYIRR